VVLKAEVMSAGDNPRFVVTSLAAPTPQMLYEDLYCARGTCENDIKAVKCDLQSDRTSATTFLANAMRLLLACAAYVLHHALRTHTLSGAFGDSYASRRRRRYRSNTRSNVPLYLAQRSANISLLLASYHQAPERLRRT
jgi:Transposase DDE domain group 1